MPKTSKITMHTIGHPINFRSLARDDVADEHACFPLAPRQYDRRRIAWPILAETIVEADRWHLALLFDFRRTMSCCKTSATHANSAP